MKNVVVFGAGSAIAQATIRLYAQEHARMVLVDRNPKRLVAVADDARVRGASSTHTITADLTDAGLHQSIIDEACKQLDTPTIVLIAYGTLGDQRASEQNSSVAEQELRTNFVSTVLLLTALANQLAKREGSTIAVISSVAGDRGRKSNYVYGAAKGGLTIFLSGLRNRLNASGVHVLTIKPGFVDTPMTKDFKKGVLWVKPDAIARGIVRAIQKQKDVVYLPWFWRYIMLIIRLIPERVFKRMSL